MDGDGKTLVEKGTPLKKFKFFRMSYSQGLGGHICKDYLYRERKRGPPSYDEKTR